MKFRMNGTTFRSASDIQEIMQSIDGSDKPSSEEIDRRIAVMSSRFDNKLDLWTGEPLVIENGEID